MKISGFSMAKNAGKLYYPIKAAVESILPIVDEYVIAIGDCDKDDNTRNEILGLGSDKIKIIDTVWDIEKYPRGTEHARQTDIAKQACSGDWLFCLQADEVVHEKYLPVITDRLEQLKDDTDVEAILLKYKHFWGDYNHYHNSHGWYAKEIRIIRNDKDIHSWESAQSFRRIPGFDYVDYRQQEGTEKLKAAQIDAYIYHYGWVRPPHFMQAKRQAFDINHKGRKRATELYAKAPKEFDFGPLDKLPTFNGTHPKVMNQWIDRFDWGGRLQYAGKPNPCRKPEKHERLKNKLLTFIEQNLLRGRQIFTFKNYILLKNK